MQLREIFEVVDMHVAGEPLRIVTAGYPPLGGGTILDKRDFLAHRLDHYRRRLMFEPWGHEAMYGCLLVDPERSDSAYGLIFMHNQGYSSMCGHATLGVVTMLVETGRIAALPGAAEVVVKLDVPSGQVVGHARLDGDGRVASAWFENVPSYAAGLSVPLIVNGGEIFVDVGFGGGYYAIVDAGQLGIRVDPDHIDELIQWAGPIKAAAEATNLAKHPLDARLNGFYGVIFTDAPGDQAHHSRTLTVFADNQVDRSPCGSCVSARLAVLAAQGYIEQGQAYRFESVIGTVFTGTWTGAGPTLGGTASQRTSISGQASVTGFRRFFGNPHDEVSPFLLR
jgi:trans-L-3-hydroxyproline dehydratase